MGSLRSAARRFACTRQRCQIDSRFVRAQLSVTFSRVPNNESYSLLSPGFALGRDEVDKLSRVALRAPVDVAVFGFLLNSFIEIPFKALGNSQYIFIEKRSRSQHSKKLLHVKCRFHFAVVELMAELTTTEYGRKYRADVDGILKINLISRTDFASAIITTRKYREEESQMVFGIISERASPMKIEIISTKPESLCWT